MYGFVDFVDHRVLPAEKNSDSQILKDTEGSDIIKSDVTVAMRLFR